MKVITVSGSPGTGKTTIAHLIEKKLKYAYVDVNKMIDEHNICDEYDTARRCKVIDSEKLNAMLIKMIKKSNDNVVIDSHLSHLLPKKYVDLCIITRCDLKILKKRLEQRGYNEKKVRENLDAEIFDLCLSEAEERGHNIMTIDTSRKINEKGLIDKIIEKL